MFSCTHITGKVQEDPDRFSQIWVAMNDLSDAWIFLQKEHSGSEKVLGGGSDLYPEIKALS